jgi:hypothetical protein
MIAFGICVGENVGKSPVVVKLMGGLGNQLFIYAAGLEQAHRLDVDIEVDTSWFEDKTNRFYSLDQLFGPQFHEAKPSQIRKTSKFASPLLKKFNLWTEFKERSHRFQPEIFTIRPGTTIEGYFQSAKYFPSVGAEIAQSIRNVEVSTSEQAIIDDVASKPFIAVHVRRGDYLTESHIRETHGLTTKGYYEASLEILGRKVAPCIVFSDSPEVAEKELMGISELVFDSRLSPLGELATLKLMSLASGIVMSNSSFSWWAAYTMSHFDPGSTVISPRPWSKDIFFNEELIHRRWWNIGL